MKTGPNAPYDPKIIITGPNASNKNFIKTPSGYTHTPTGATLEIYLSKGEEDDHGNTLQHNLYYVLDFDGEQISCDYDDYEQGKHAILDHYEIEE